MKKLPLYAPFQCSWRNFIADISPWSGLSWHCFSTSQDQRHTLYYAFESVQNCLINYRWLNFAQRNMNGIATIIWECGSFIAFTHTVYWSFGSAYLHNAFYCLRCYTTHYFRELFMLTVFNTVQSGTNKSRAQLMNPAYSEKMNPQKPKERHYKPVLFVLQLQKEINTYQPMTTTNTTVFGWGGSLQEDSRQSVEGKMKFTTLVRCDCFLLHFNKS